MKKSVTTLLLVFIAIISLSEVSYGQYTGKQTGIGVMIGEPTGITLKSWTGTHSAFDVGLAWSLGHYDAVNIHADYLWHEFDIFQDVEEGTLPLYYGVGGRLVFAEDDALLGARVPVGLNYYFEDSPLGLFVEIAPVVNLAPSTDFDMEGALGVRFYL